MSKRAWPTELRFSKSAQALTVSFDDGEAFGPKPPPPIVSDDIGVEKADPVGRYAVRIHFSDGHANGLYTWAYLRELGEKLAA